MNLTSSSRDVYKRQVKGNPAGMQNVSSRTRPKVFPDEDDNGDRPTLVRPPLAEVAEGAE